MKIADLHAETERLLVLASMATTGPWTWIIQDASTATLGRADDWISDGFVMDSSPCESCCKGKESWKFGRCTTPSSENANFIAAAPDMAAHIKRLDARVCELEQLHGASLPG